MTEPKKIQINKWRIREDLSLVSYTATWCGPCTRIKPHLLDLVKELELVDNQEILKEDKPKDIQFIPFFQIFKGNDLFKSIQTSDKDQLTTFVSDVIRSDPDDF
jgi:thiol-disulfide isomerase/thioredoxin